MDPLGRVKLGTTGLEVTTLGLGTAPLGGWPTAVPEEQGLATVKRAWDRGLRYFDTAPFYGHGLSERYIGETLRGDRDRFTLSTKVGRVLEPGEAQDPLFQGTPGLNPVFDFSEDGIRRSLADSRSRFGFEQIDIVFLHDPETDEHHQKALQSAYPVLANLRDAGEIAAIGVGMNWSEPLAQFATEADFDVFLLAGRYTLLEQDSMDDLLPRMQENNVSLVAGGVYNSGLLVDPTPDATYDYQPAPPEVVERAQDLKSVCDDFGVPLRAAAIQFPLHHPVVACVVVGARTPEQLDDNIEMMQLDIPDQLWIALKERDLLRPDAPVPR